jgi:hypothetical protein
LGWFQLRIFRLVGYQGWYGPGALLNCLKQEEMAMSVDLIMALILLAAQDPAEKKLTVQDLMDAYASGNAVHSLDVDITMVGKSISPAFVSAFAPADKHYRFLYVMTSTSERIQFVSDSPPVKGFGYPTNIKDFLRKPNGSKYLQNYDWSKPQPLTPVHQGTIQAQILSATTVLPVGVMDPGAVLLRRFSFLGGTEHRTLRELVARDGSNAEVVPSTELGLIKLKVRELPTKGKTSQNYHLIYFDSSRNFAISRADTHVVGDTSLTKDPISFVRKTVVELYHDEVGGVFIPKTVVETVEENASVSIESRFDVKLGSVNQPIDPARAEFEFPQHVVVNKEDPSKRRFEAWLWGKDGPLFEVRDRAHLVAFWGQDDPLLAQDKSVKTAYVVVLLAFVVLSGGYWWLRRRRGADRVAA